MNERHRYVMPFEWWMDADAKEIKRRDPDSGKENPEVYYKVMMWKAPDGLEYLLNNKNRAYMTKEGPFSPPYYSIDKIEDVFPSGDIFVFCPGPSMAEVDLSVFEGRPTIAVNSAGYKMDSTLWCMFETGYVLWLMNRKDIPKGRHCIMTARGAVRWRHFGKTPFSRTVFIPRFEELKTMPHRTPAVSTMGALVTAWWLGAKRIYVVGLDLSRPKKQPYVTGVPYTPEGASNPFDDQIRALRQFKLPGVEILNGSPHSSKFGLPFTSTTYDEIQRVATQSPRCITENVIAAAVGPSGGTKWQREELTEERRG